MKPEEIDDNAPLFGEGLGLDSIDSLELMVLLERNYGIKIEDAREGRKILHQCRPCRSTFSNTAKYNTLHG